MADPLLKVWWGHRCVGRLQRTDDGFSFTYDRLWLEDPRARPISLSLPLREEPWGRLARNFFANLLPEGAVREALSRSLRIAHSDDFGFLRALGREVAGALSIVPVGESPPGPGPGTTRPLTADEIARWREGADVLVDVTTEEVRLSLAGAQDKVAVLRDSPGNFLLPLAGQPTTHILKFRSRAFRHLPLNEHLTLTLAREMGLPTVATSLSSDDPPFLVVERYDRIIASDGTVKRIHQEDLCQALGRSSEEKYEDSPTDEPLTFAACWRCVRDASVAPLPDLRALTRWMSFNALVGNDDGHGKNLALLHGPEGPRLAPFYDLVSTVAVPRVSRRHAFRIGGHDDAATLARVHWERQAAALDVRRATLVDEVQRQHELIETALDATLSTLPTPSQRPDLHVQADVWRKALRTRARRVALSVR